MKRTYELTLQDVYGGDGVLRFIQVEEAKLTRTKSTKRTRSDIGVAVESGMAEVMTEKVRKDVQTFRYDEDGMPLLRLGGAHGKLWGALREARSQLYAMGNAQYRSPRLIDSIQVSPVWAKLEPLAEMQVQILPQILNQMGRTSMITQRFDVIPKAKVQVDVIFPDQMESYMDGLLEQMKNMSLFNKRRTTIVALRQLPS